MRREERVARSAGRIASSQQPVSKPRIPFLSFHSGVVSVLPLPLGRADHAKGSAFPKRERRGGGAEGRSERDKKRARKQEKRVDGKEKKKRKG